jgi:hypothetical protein
MLQTQRAKVLTRTRLASELDDVLPAKLKPRPTLQMAVALLVLAVSLVLVYSPSFTNEFAFSDDYFCLYEKLRNQLWADGFWMQFCLQARPLDALFFIPLMSNVHKIADLLPLRAVAVDYIVCLSFCFYAAFRTIKFAPYQAAALALCLCTVPSFQIWSVWAIAAHAVVAGIFSYLSFHVLQSQLKSPNISWLMAPVPFLLQLCAAAIYQPASMLFWSFLAISLFDDEASFAQKVKIFAAGLLVVGTSMVLDFGVFLWAKQHFGASGMLEGRSHLTGDVVGKLKWFLKGPLLDSLNIFRISDSLSFASKAAAFICLGLPFAFTGAGRERTLLFLMALSLIPLAYLPNLLVAESFSTYRSQTGLIVLVMLYALMALFGFLKLLRCRSRVLTVVLCSLAVFSAFIAYENVVNYFVIPQTLELALLRAQIDQQFGAHAANHPILFERLDTLAPSVKYDEFGMPSSAQFFAKQPIQVLLRLERADKLNSVH